MQSRATVHEIIAMARSLSPVDQSMLIERLAAALTPTLETVVAEERAAEELYVQGYQDIPEETSDVAALLPHLPLQAIRFALDL